MRRKKKKKTEIQINKLRIKSEITVIIFAVDKGKRGYKLYDTY